VCFSDTQTVEHGDGPPKSVVDCVDGKFLAHQRTLILRTYVRFTASGVPLNTRGLWEGLVGDGGRYWPWVHQELRRKGVTLLLMW